MKIKELTADQFVNYANNHILSSFYQTPAYATFMEKQGYSYDYIGYFDENGKILAASLILYRKIKIFTKYGYAPKGFLIDYMNQELLINFTKDLKKYYRKKGFAFIKINPEIAIGELIPINDYKVKYNQNNIISNYLEPLKYRPIKKDKAFKNDLPVYNAILPLKNFELEKLAKATRNKVRTCIRKGLELEKADGNAIEIIYEFIKKQKDRTLDYYKDLFYSFNKYGTIEILLVKTNYKKFIENIKQLYEEELERNTVLASIVQDDPREINIKKKMESDELIALYKEDMINATKGFNNYEEVYIAGAIIIKHKQRTSIFISGYDKQFDYLNPNYFLHYALCEYYKEDFDFLDLNGISGDFDPESKFYGLNMFKIGFNPKIYEFIGEYDLVINSIKYTSFISSPKLLKKYKKKRNQF